MFLLVPFKITSCPTDYSISYPTEACGFFEIDVTVFGGSPDYTVNLFEDGDLINPIASSTISGQTANFEIIVIEAGTFNYFVTIENEMGVLCTGVTQLSGSEDITVYTEGSFGVGQPLDPTCQGEAFEITIFAGGGMTPYTAQLFENGSLIGTQTGDGPNFTFIVDGNFSGDFDYGGSVSDAIGCPYNVPLVIPPPHTIIPSPNINPIDPIEACQVEDEMVVFDLTIYHEEISTGNDISWFFESDGSIPILSISDFMTSANITIYAQAQGSNGCFSEFLPVDVVLNNFTLECSLEESSVLITTENANLPLNITWSGNSTGSAISALASFTITDLEDGNYTIIVEDDLGCSETCMVEIMTTPETCDHPDVPNLIAFYNATNGSDWMNNSGWIDGVAETNCDPCGLEAGNSPWRGISCDDDANRVVQIELENNGLTGSLILLNGLDSLRIINLSNNNIQGGQWNWSNENLFSIDLSDVDSLNTELPDFNLSNLEFLFAFNSGLMGELPSWNNVPKLREAFIYNNQFTGEIPNWQLDSLRGLSLFNCGLTGNLPALDVSVKMIELYVDSNALTGPLLAYDHMEDLTDFAVRSNNLSGCYPIRSFCDFNWFTAIDNPQLPFEGDYEPICDGQSEIGSSCDDGDALTINDVIQDDCACSGESSTEPCGELSCGPIIDFPIFVDGPNAMPLSILLTEGIDIFDCFSFDPIVDVDTIYFDCSHVCIDTLVTVYNLETGTSCSTPVSIVALSSVCEEFTPPEIRAELVDFNFTGQAFIEVDMLISGFVDINEYRFEVSYDNDLLEYVDTANANLEINPRINLANNGNLDYIIVWDQDGVQTLINQEAEARLITFIFKPKVLPFCDPLEIKLSESMMFGNIATTCQSYFTPISPEVTDADVLIEVIPPEFSPADPQTCLSSEITISIVNTSDYASIEWQDGQLMSEVSLTPEMTQNYTVTLRDFKGCSLDTFITIVVAEELSVDITSVDLCDNVPQNISVSDQYENYSWEFEGTSIGNNENQLLISEMGIYSIEVTDINGCTGSATVMVENFVSPTVDLTQDTIEVCDNNSDGVTLVDLTALTSESGVWSTASMIDISNPSMIDFNGQAIGSYEFVFTTNTAMLPCENANDNVFVIVTSCSECSEGGCLQENPPVWLDAQSVPDITVSCANDIPPPTSLMCSNGLVGDCLSEGTILAERNESNFDGCSGTITDVWSFTTVCGDDIQPYERTITIMQNGTLEFTNMPEANVEISCDEVDLLKINLDYEIVEGSECIEGGIVQPVISENYDECGGTVVLTWTVNPECYDELTFTQTATILANDIFTFQDAPSDITISCDQLPFEPQVLLVSNDLNAACSIEVEVQPVSVPEVADCPGAMVNTWAYIHPCTGEQLSHSQIITIEECSLPTLEQDYQEVIAGEIYSVDLLENDIVADSFSISFVETEREDLFLSQELNSDGTFDFTIANSFFDTINITYKVCNLECNVCDIEKFQIVDEALKDIFLTDIISPDGDGMNDALRFNFEAEISDTHLYIFNRWGAKIYEKIGYTNDWDASGYPGGVYYYVLRVGMAEVKKTLTIVK